MPQSFIFNNNRDIFMSARHFKLYLFITFSLLLKVGVAQADSLSIPQELEPWRDWVLHDEKQLDCPWLMQGGVGKVSSKDRRWCFWPKRLTIDSEQNSARFRFELNVYRDGLFPLPGSAKHWPTAVKVNGMTASLTDQNNNPMIHLKKGEHVITGKFRWSKPPTVLRVPKQVALITLNGKPGTFLNGRDEQLVLSRKSSKQVATQQDSLRLEVYRLLSDGLPMQLETQLHLQVSGKAREVELGLAAIKDSSLLDIRSPLPVRLEANGNLRVQVKPGQYVIRLMTHIAQRQTKFEARSQTKYWPGVEYWSFKQDTNFRTVTLSGAPSIDTAMISIPAQWRQFPTYRLSTTQSTPQVKSQSGVNYLMLETNLRGDTSTQENRLTIKRDIWLDFDGGAYTALDHIHGAMYQHWRLNTAKGVELGRATVNGSPVLVTAAKDTDAQSGVEIRSQNVQLEAVSRMNKQTDLLMSGWDTLFDQVSVNLHLPPGWKVLHISGAESVTDSWLTKWDLWDLFLVLVLIALTHKLLGLPIAVLATTMLVLSYKLPESPIVFWPILLALIGLIRVISGRWLKGVQIGAAIVSFFMIIAVIGFCVQQLRFAVYPYLEHQGIDTYQDSWGSDYSGGMPSASMQMDEAEEMMTEPQVEFKGQVRKSLSKAMVSNAYQAPVRKAPVIDLYQVSDTDRLQTGPGLPSWNWNAVQYSRTGPVSADTRVDIYYVTPWMSRLWHVLSAVLVAIFAAVLLSRLWQSWSGKPLEPQNESNTETDVKNEKTSVDSSQKGFVFVNMLINSVLAFFSALLLAVLLLPEQSHAETGDFPPEHILHTLKQRLLQPPECAPYCAALHSAKLAANADRLEIDFIADVKAPMAIALPGANASSSAKQVMWQPTQVSVDNRPAVLSRYNKNLILSLEPGSHRIKMRGPLSGESVQVAFPRAIHNLSWFSSDWDLEGLVDGRVIGGALQLTAKPIKKAVTVKSAGQREEDAVLVPNAIKPFVIVTRKLVMGKRWELMTQVSRVAPSKGAFSINIPLLKNEQVLSEFIRVKQDTKETTEDKNFALLSFKPNQSVISWNSRLDPVTELTLTALEFDQFVENWRIVPGALWHVSYDGIPPVKQNHSKGPLNPLWKPWANETLTVKVERPEGVEGQIQTIESATLNYNAASDVRSATLNLDIRASQGERFEAGLPEGAKITALYHDGRSLNVPLKNQVIVQLKPGLQQVQVDFQLAKPEGFQLVDTTPKIELFNGAANIRIDYQLGRDRWPLYLSGPLIGPAMLIWGVLFVILAAAFILAWVKKQFELPLPVSLTGWLLLGIGLSTVNSFGLIFIALFFILMAMRLKQAEQNGFALWSQNRFNIMQVGLVCLSILASLMIIFAIPQGLLSSPEMQVTGNGSNAFFYSWYQDRVSGSDFPVASVVSVPLFVYRLAMLLWSLWLAMKLVTWVVWAWNAFTAGGSWKNKVHAEKS